jgi:hypothetical protein
MFKEFPRTENKRVEDVTWIPKVTEYGWIILAKDAFRKPPEQRSILACRARVFSLPNANMTAAAMVARFLDSHERIFSAAATAGPYHYAVGPDRLRVVKLKR